MIPKFRIWDKKQDKMFDIEEIKFVYDELIDYTQTFIYYNNQKHNMALVLYYFENEVMQSTGKIDDHRKEIFEGDVVEIVIFKESCDDVDEYYEYEYKGIVKQLDGCWVIDTNDETIELYSDIDEIEIVGHKYMEDYKEFLNE